MCGAKFSGQTFVAREMMFGLGGEFEYWTCSSCDSVQISNIPENLGSYYPDDYYSMNAEGSGKTAKEKVRASLVNLVLRLHFMGGGFLRPVLPSPKRGDLLALMVAGATKRQKILDVGCGSNPLLLNLLSKIGFSDLTGADPFIAEGQTLRNGVKLHKKDISEVDGVFDLIVLNHSIEHVVEPQRDLIELARKMKSEGRAVVRLPTPSSEAFLVYRENWVQLDAPRHLNLPSRRAMQDMIHNAGLRIVSNYDDSTDLQFYGSELYKQNVPLTHKDAQENFTNEQMQKFLSEACRLNAQDRGDQVTYILAHQ